MPGSRAVVVLLAVCVMATSCDDAEAPQQNPGSPEAIEALASMERSVEDIDVCEAIRDAGAEDDLADILGAASVELKGAYSESEDAFTQLCAVSAAGHPDMVVSFKALSSYERQLTTLWFSPGVGSPRSLLPPSSPLLLR